MASSLVICEICQAPNQMDAKSCSKCGKQLPRYILLHQVGRGGFGVVYKAEDRLYNRPVAMKEMNPSGLSQQERSEAITAFNNEANLLARLMHPNLPRIYEHFEKAGCWYLVMDFIEGETLEEYLHKKGGKLPVAEVLTIGVQLVIVLDYLHTRPTPIIFRDLKPPNIMRTSHGHLFLIDFGIARHFKPGQAKDTRIVGSPGYAAPEQYGNAQTTTRSDIYSLGAVLHELLSGNEPPTNTPTPYDFPPLKSYVPSISPELETLIMQMLDINMNKRPESMVLVKEKLEQITSQLIGSSPTASTTVSPPSTLPATVQPDICSFCGTQNSIGTAFCVNCGNSLLGTVASTPPVVPNPIQPNQGLNVQHLSRRKLFPQLAKAGLATLGATGLVVLLEKRFLYSSTPEVIGENLGILVLIGSGAATLTRIDQHKYTSSRRKFFAKSGEFIGAATLLFVGTSILGDAVKNLPADPEWYLHPIDRHTVLLKANENYEYHLPDNYILLDSYFVLDIIINIDFTVNNSSSNLSVDRLDSEDQYHIIEYFAPNGSAINSWKTLVEQKKIDYKAGNPGYPIYIRVYETNHTDKDGHFNQIYNGT